MGKITIEIKINTFGKTLYSFDHPNHTKVEQYRLLGWSSRMLPWCNSTYICSVCPMMMPSTTTDCHFGQKAVSQYTATKIQILTYSKENI